MTTSTVSTPVTDTLSDLTSEFVAIYAEEHFSSQPESTKAELVSALNADIEARFAGEPDNLAGYEMAKTAIVEADQEGVLEPDFNASATETTEQKIRALSPVNWRDQLSQDFEICAGVDAGLAGIAPSPGASKEWLLGHSWGLKNRVSPSSVEEQRR